LLAKNDNAVYLTYRVDSFAGKHRSNRYLLHSNSFAWFDSTHEQRDGINAWNTSKLIRFFAA